MQVRDNTMTLWKHKDFLKLWAGQTISLAGSQVTTLALPLVAVITLNATPFQMGLFQVANSIPVLLLGLFVGVWVDRMRRRPILITADLGRALLLGSIPLAALFHFLHIEYLYLVIFLVGILNLFFDVAHTSLLPSLVTRERIVEGNSKLEVSRSGAMMFGPALAGILVQLVTAPLAMIVDALSFVGSACFLIRIRQQEEVSRVRDQKTGILADIGEGLRAIWSNQLLRTLASSLATYNFFASMVNTMYLLYATRFLKVPPSLLGVIFGLGSVGFMLGALLANPAKKRFGIGPTIVWAACISDVGFLLIALTANQPLLIAVPLLIGAQFISTLTGPITAINQLSLRQSITPDRLQGRVNGTMRFTAQCLSPIGGLVAGTIGSAIGLWPAIFIGTLGIQFGFVILLFSPVRTFREQPQAAATGD